MATYNQAGQILKSNYGPLVVRAAAVLPQTATQSIFNVVGGNVLITSLFGVITTAVQAQSTTVKLNISNTLTGTNADASSAVADINAAAVGTFVAPPAAGLNSGNAMQVILFPNQNNEFAVGPGAIRVATGASSTGAWRWYCNYVSLDNGAYVSAA